MPILQCHRAGHWSLLFIYNILRNLTHPHKSALKGQTQTSHHREASRWQASRPRPITHPGWPG